MIAKSSRARRGCSYKLRSVSSILQSCREVLLVSNPTSEMECWHGVKCGADDVGDERFDQFDVTQIKMLT